MIGAHKMTEERAEVIKALLKGGEHTHQQIADLALDIWGVNISRELVTLINSKKRWHGDIRSFEMKESKPKTGNDFRDFGPPPNQRTLTKKDMETIQRIINKYVELDD